RLVVGIIFSVFGFQCYDERNCRFRTFVAGTETHAPVRCPAHYSAAVPASTSRIHALWTQFATVLPLPFLRSGPTPKERNALIISRWALTAAGAPVPPRPVFCTAR